MPKTSTQKEKLAKAADDRGEAFDADTKKATISLQAKVCPECGHVFQGSGWDGIDAHWKAKHDHVMPYNEAWPLLKAGRYSK